ncbi:signal recognition particle receptor FtsY [Bacteroidia bacterium]|nr:signal recognition particle receptor FtsY [Bacteroidia bacterium]
MNFFSHKSKNADSQLSRGGLLLGLSKTHESWLSRLAGVVSGKSKIDDAVLEKLEEMLLTSDVGVDTTLKIIERLQTRAKKDNLLKTDDLKQVLSEEIENLLYEPPALSSLDTAKPYVIMVVGVNGAGKTTTIGKLAAQLTAQGKKVYIGAADTFRAAAIEQLDVWAQRAGAALVRQQTGADPAAVAFDAVQSGTANNADVVLIDTAGRLHNKINLMNELTKIRTVIGKAVPNAPHEVLLVLDGSTGQNAFVQAQEFAKATTITALAITKLDGTAKGGVVIGISDQMNIPVKYIGVGEQVADLQLFDKQVFVKSLLA